MLLSLLFACVEIDICTGVPPEDASALSFAVVSWESGPDYDSIRGWTGEVYSTTEEWQAFLSEGGLIDPVPDVDFSVSDVLLYERSFNGCDHEVIFDGAYLLDQKRYIRSQQADLKEVCDLYFEEHAVLIVEKVEGATLEFCEL